MAEQTTSPAPRTRLKHSFERIGDHLVEGFELLALFVIGAAIVWSAAPPTGSTP